MLFVASFNIFAQKTDTLTLTGHLSINIIAAYNSEILVMVDTINNHFDFSPLQNGKKLINNKNSVCIQFYINGKLEKSFHHPIFKDNPYSFYTKEKFHYGTIIIDNRSWYIKK